MRYKFPEIKFSQINTFIEQLEHLLSECKELANELPLVYTDSAISCMKPRIMSEVLDIMQSAESMCRVYEREGGDLDRAELEHLRKDRVRGYHVKGCDI